MNLSKFHLFNMITGRMGWLSQRQGVLAGNIANANTPGYVPRDLKPIDFRSHLRADGGRGLALAATNAAHQTGGRRTTQFVDQPSGDSHEVTLSGNAVQLEIELQKVSETGIDYQTMTNLYRKHMDMLKTAISGSR